MKQGWIALALSMLSGAAVAATAVCSSNELVYLGSAARQLSALRFDACAGKLGAMGVMAELPKPRWVLAHPQLPLVYVANDAGDTGMVSAFAFDRKSGALNPVNEVEAGGSGSTYLNLDSASNTLLVANFGGGSVASIPVKPDGSLGPKLSSVRATGTGPHRRQASAHAHGITVDPSGRYALVADLGADRVFVHGFERATQTLSADVGAAFVAPPGSGPRRAVFGASGRFVYVLSELSAELMVLRWDAPRLTQVQTLAISSPAFIGTPSASEIAVSADGRFVYVADRGESSLVVYAVDAMSGELTLLQRLPSGGEAPWAFEIHRSGKWLLVANYRSNRLNLFRVDAESGRLSDSGRSLESHAPVSVLFVN